ncbi:MAG TPA: carbohydrate ABC transporter permease [Ruminiclostridium sp.]
MSSKTKINLSAFDIFNTIFLSFLTFVTLYPFIYVLFASISDPFEMMRYNGFLLWPKGFSLEAYKMVAINPNIALGFGNTLFYVIVGSSINVILTSLAAYVLSRKSFTPRKYFMLAIVFSMMFSGGMIPTYLLVRDLGLYNTRWALIFPTAINTINFIIMRTSFLEIPDSIEESVRIDGANDFQVLYHIVLPLSKAVIAVITLFYTVYHWNSWFNASIYLTNRALYPLQLVLREILIQNDTAGMMIGTSSADNQPIGETIKYATIMVSTLPILCVYPFIQRYFVTGVMLGGVKG